MTAAQSTLEQLERNHRAFAWPKARLWLAVVAIIAFYAVSWRLAQIDLARLATGLPKLGHWIARAWPCGQGRTAPNP